MGWSAAVRVRVGAYWSVHRQGPVRWRWSLRGGRARRKMGWFVLLRGVGCVCVMPYSEWEAGGGRVWQVRARGRNSKGIEERR